VPSQGTVSRPPSLFHGKAWRCSRVDVLVVKDVLAFAVARTQTISAFG